ncbi:MAG: hypothetical protein PHS14_07685 [Elusimicrobia bacterium]|nr:hypothetical protein [Elusimicrobiota bacterium]
MNNEVRDYALESGAFVMIYPPVAPRILPEAAREEMVGGFKKIFGAGNWPSLG